VASVAVSGVCSRFDGGSVLRRPRFPNRGKIAGLADSESVICGRVYSVLTVLVNRVVLFPGEAEVARVFVNALRIGQLPAADQAYLAKLTAARTGISQAEAEQRVKEVFAQARQTE